MQPVRVKISSDDSPILRSECARLGIQVSGRTRLETLRRELRAYNQRYLLWQRWQKLATMLFGENHGIDTSTQDTVIDGVANKLYERLYAAELAEAGTVIRDERNKLHFAIGSRQGARNVNVTYERDGEEGTSNGTIAILYAAQCAFPDVAETVATWESNKERAE